VLGRYCEGSQKVLWRRWLSTQPIESQVKVDRPQSVTQTLGNATETVYNMGRNREISLFRFFEFFIILKKLKFKIFKFFQFLIFNMFVKTYEIQASSAINGIKVDESSVFVTYTSNIDKEYEFKCENTQEFDENLSNTLKTNESVGKLVNSSIKEGKLVPVTK